jgi:hypothetical protein
MNVEWINPDDKLPIDLWREEFPSDNNYENIIGDYLAVFIDYDPDTGVVWDEEVVAVRYSGKIGWVYYNSLTPHLSADKICKWMPLPNP